MRNESLIRDFSLIVACILLVISFQATPVYSQDQDSKIGRHFCIYTPIGKRGPVTRMTYRYRAAAVKWGVKMDLNIYNDEFAAVEDFKNGQCDAVGLLGPQARKLVKFGGGLGQAGAIPTFEHLQTVVQAYARPKAKEFMKNEKYEIAGIYPAGKVHLFLGEGVMENVGDQLQLSDLAGRKMALIEGEPQLEAAAKKLGLSISRGNIAAVFNKFNNQSVDIITTTGSSYAPLELNRGLGETGRIIRKPALGMVNYYVIIHRDRFPDDFGPKSRQHSSEIFSDVLDMVRSVRSDIPEKYWLTPSPEFQRDLRGILKEIRKEFTKKGVFDPEMTRFFRRVRCNKNPERAECS